MLDKARTNASLIRGSTNKLFYLISSINGIDSEAAIIVSFVLKLKFFMTPKIILTLFRLIANVKIFSL